eukprot:5886689-Lingulodinium_polyedra.AAC.1
MPCYQRPELGELTMGTAIAVMWRVVTCTWAQQGNTDTAIATTMWCAMGTVVCNGDEELS